jgi:aarF domain-containing kinase
MSTVASEVPAERLPEVSTTDALDSLRSPEQTEFVTRLPERESIATFVSELDDIALDDDEPPTSASSSVATPTPTPAHTPVNLKSNSLGPEANSEQKEYVNGGPVNNEDGNGVKFDVSLSRKAHHKSVSVTTIRSGHTVSFIEEKRRSTRISFDGQQALQEEFSRLQKERQALQEQGVEGAIDWGKLVIELRKSFLKLELRPI